MPRTALIVTLLALLFAAACNSDTYTEESDQRNRPSEDWEATNQAQEPMDQAQEPMDQAQEPMDQAQEPMNTSPNGNQQFASSPSASGTQVAILDHGFQMTRGTQVIPNGWKLTQDIATDPNTNQATRFHLEIRGPNGELLKALGIGQYSQIMGTSFDQTLHQMTMRGLGGEIQNISIGRLQPSATLEQTAQFQKAMHYASGRGLRVQGLEAPIKGSRNGKPVAGILYVGHFAAANVQGTGTIQVSAIAAPPDGLENAIRINEQITRSYRSNPQFEQRMQQAHAGAMQRQNAEHQRWMASSRAQHQQRMADNQARFNSHQQMMQGQYRANDQQHAQWMDNFRNSGSSAWSGSDYTSHDSYIDGIHERSTFQDPYSGQQVSQDGQYDNWYNNGLGDYYGTDDPSFDPNSMDGNWERIEPLQPNR